MEMVLDHLLDREERPLHLSFDIDAVDPLYAPSTVRHTRTYIHIHIHICTCRLSPSRL